MVIEESISINATKDAVWRHFTDLTCWVNWNSVLRDVTTERGSIQKGETFGCSMRPFVFPVHFESFIEEVVPYERVVWSGSKYGIFARHEFFFREGEGRVQVISRETFKGITMDNMKFIFPAGRIRELTKSMLKDLKKAAEGTQ
jgi:hypothetical protein